MDFVLSAAGTIFFGKYCIVTTDTFTVNRRKKKIDSSLLEDQNYIFLVDIVTIQLSHRREKTHGTV